MSVYTNQKNHFINNCEEKKLYKDIYRSILKYKLHYLCMSFYSHYQSSCKTFLSHNSNSLFLNVMFLLNVSWNVLKCIFWTLVYSQYSWNIIVLYLRIIFWWNVTWQGYFSETDVTLFIITPVPLISDRKRI